MLEIKTEGVVLKTVPIKENHLVVTLFTAGGLINILAKRVSTPEKRNLLSPFSHIEVIYRKTNSDLYHFKDGSMISDYRFLRDKWDYLETAGKMVRMLLHSQFPGKPAPLLYALFKSCLNQLPHFEDTQTLVLLFYLKLLTHEGLLSWSEPSSFPISVSPPDWSLLKELAKSRSFKGVQKQKGLSSLLEQFDKNLKNIL